MTAHLRVTVSVIISAALLTGGRAGDDSDDATPSSSDSTTSDATASATADEPVETEEDVDIGGRELYMRCWGVLVNGEPSILLMSGYDLLTSSWELFATEFAADGHHLCTYDRAGVGRSDPAPEARRTTEDLVADAVALLDAADLEEPVVLVAHSLGSLPAIGLVERAPERVAGVVLVDPLSPRVSVVQRATLPPKSPGEPQAVTDERAFLNDFLNDPTQNREHLLLAESEAEVASLLDRPGPLFGDLPVIVLQAPYAMGPPGIPPSYDKATRQARSAGNEEFAAESTQGAVVEVEDSGHHIQDDRPDAVIDAILDVLAG
jgi:pimeloyl-ACP methyl ester carboxylesterase